MATENGPASRDSKLNDTTTSVIKSVRRLSANAMSISTSVSSLQLDVDSMQSPSEYLLAMKSTKNEAKLLKACEKLSLCFQGDSQVTEPLNVEEVVRVTYQVMINHPLNPNLLQCACEILWRCNERTEYRQTIEEYSVFRPILMALKNHKQNPYFLGVAMNALASIASSALSCKGLRQSQAYIYIASVLQANKYDVFVLTGGLEALAYVLRNDSFSQSDLLQKGYHILLKEIIKTHFQKPAVVSNACLVLRQLASIETSKHVLLESDSFQMCWDLLKMYSNDEKVTTSVFGFLEALSSSYEFPEYVTATDISLGVQIFSSLTNHSNSTDLCTYGFLILHHIVLDQSSLLISGLKLEDLLRYMYTAYETHGSDTKFQEAFCCCLSSLFETSPRLHMFVGGSEPNDSQIRIPLINWIWVILLSNIKDTQNYKTYEAVCLTIYYLVVDSSRLCKYFLEKGAVLAIFEGLRRFIGISEIKFENCLRYSCQALVALIMGKSKDSKKDLINIDAVYELIDILDNHIVSPDIIAEALGVIACLSDNETFRKTASQQNLHTKILNSIQYKPTHAVLIECSIEVLIIYAQLDTSLCDVYNESGIFREIIDILSRDMGESITCKCLMLLHIIADEDHLSTYPKDRHRVGWLLNRFLIPNQQYTTLIIEALVCACSLCKSCSNVIPELLVDCRVDVNLFKLLYFRSSTDMSLDEDSPDRLIYELAIDVIHSLSLREGCCQKMLISAIKNSMIEAVKLLIDIGADINKYDESNCSDSPIYQAVMSSNDDMVECILEYNVTNKNTLKECLQLSRQLQLDYITGLLLRALSFNVERRTLNIGGLDLEEIRPMWIYPSLNIIKKPDQKSRGHRRNRSLDYVVDGIKRRKSVGESPVKNLLSTFAVASTSLLGLRKKSSEAEDAYSLSKLWDSRLFKTSESPQKQRRASRQPGLPTVISSPLAAVKLPDSPSESNGNNIDKQESMEFANLQGSSSPSGGVDVTDQHPLNSKFYIGIEDEDLDDKLRSHIPQRRHVELSKTMTGATHIAFNTLDMYERDRAGSIATLVSPNDSLFMTHNAISPGRIRRAALRSKRKNKSYYPVASESSSPFYSSEEGTIVSSQTSIGEKSSSNSRGSSRGSSYKELLDSVTTTPKDKRSELLSNLTTSMGGVDETDSPHVTSPPRDDNGVLINVFDLSANKLESLDTLVENGNEIAVKLRDLILLDAKQNTLSSLPSYLFQELNKLQNLLLGHNSFSVFPLEVRLCHKLVELDLSSNKVASFPQEKIVLQHLVKLSLNGNCLTEYPINLNGDNFPLLKILHLESNQISHIEDRDFKMKNLQELYISKNSLKELPFQFLAGLTSLRTLDASRNSLEYIPGEAAEYTCTLQDLKVGYNKLGIKQHEFHEFIRTALVIQNVDATENELMSIPPPYMWRSRGLKHLLLKTNKISLLDLTECDRFWPQLERLVIADNKLKEIPADIGKLRTLTSLDISHNRDIRHLPNEMGKLEFLFYLNLQGLKNLHIDRTLSAKAVIRYLKAKLTHSRPCYTMKMAVVGSAGKGKTTLLNLLVNEKSNEKTNTATLGVQIRKWIYQQRPGVNYVINCWDFAGQEEFYSTHQCFLTPRTIYILAYNISKAESELDALVPWLLNIQARAPGSPVIIVGTHRDMIAGEHFNSVKKNMRQHINEIIIRPGFPQDVTFAEVSCVGQKVGLDNLRTKIKEKIDGAKLRGQKIMGEMVPASYLDLASMLEEESKRLVVKHKNTTFHVLRRHQLYELMSKTDLAQRMDRIEIEQAVQFLHECGSLLHYDDIQSNLSDLFFVDPQWLCSLMAKIITIKQLTLISAKGTLHVKDLPLLLRGSQFPSEFITEYIRLLEWFNVALQISSDDILIPSYLSKHKPVSISLPANNRIIRRYKMCFIPPGFWPRLVIRLLTFPSKAFQLTEPIKQVYWYNGLYSFWSMQDYFMIEQLEKSKNEFDITVPNTPEGIRLLCSVVDNVETLIDEWFPGLRNVDISSGDALVHPSALCPMCPAFNTHVFSMKDLQQLSITKDEVYCPVHKDVVSLKLLSPDVIISDLSPSYHVSRDEVIMDENNPASVLGKGGFGEVYKAMHKNKLVAVKVFSPLVAEMHNTTPNQLIRQEVSVLSQLIHPYILSLIGVCLRPKPMILLELAELGSLASFSPYSNVSPNLKHRISVQVVNALAFLHKHNVIYRDLKPGNILIFSLSLNATVNAKLSDYGISTYTTTTGLTQDIGTAGYKAPEILKAKTTKMPYNTKVDIYSFGIVLYQLITNGHLPFEDLAPHERDRATEEGREMINPSYYGGQPWPDMNDIILHCLQYLPKHRPTAQEIFDRMCCSEFMALRQVIPIHQDWEVLTFTVKSYMNKNDKKQHDELMTDIWLSSCDVGQQSMLSVVNVSHKSSQPQGKMMPQNVLIYTMVSIGQSLVLLGTNTGEIIVYENYDKKEYKLAPLEDSVLCLCSVRRRGEGKSYVFAGLANGSLVAFEYKVLKTPKASPDIILSLNKGPVKGIKRLHSHLVVISGLEVFVINLSTLAIEKRWLACEDSSRKFLTCIEVDEDVIWTSSNNSSIIQGWDSEDGSHRMTINIFNCLQKLDHTDVPDRYSCRVTALYLQSSSPALLWAGTASGHLFILDTATGQPLMVTKRHTNAIRSIQSTKISSHERPVNVVITSGLGFIARPHSKSDAKSDHYGILLMWDSSMPQVKPTFDEMKKQQLPYQ